MSEEISRRSFMSGSFLTALSISLTGCFPASSDDLQQRSPETPAPVKRKTAAPKTSDKESTAEKEVPLHVNVDHSGPGYVSASSVGVLVVANAPKHLDKMRIIRRELKYFRPLRHNSTDMQRVPYGNALIDYFFKNEDMRFVAVLTSHESPRRDELALAIKHLRKGGLGASLDPTVLARAAAVYKGFKGEAADEMGQLADILTGAVYVDFSRSPSQRRSEFAKTLKQRLKASRLTPFNGHPRFSVLTE